MGLAAGDTLAGALATGIDANSPPGAYEITQGGIDDANNPNYEISFTAGVIFGLVPAQPAGPGTPPPGGLIPPPPAGGGDGGTGAGAGSGGDTGAAVPGGGADSGAGGGDSGTSAAGGGDGGAGGGDAGTSAAGDDGMEGNPGYGPSGRPDDPGSGHLSGLFAGDDFHPGADQLRREVNEFLGMMGDEFKDGGAFGLDRGDDSGGRGGEGTGGLSGYGPDSAPGQTRRARMEAGETFLALQRLIALLDTRLDRLRDRETEDPDEYGWLPPHRDMLVAAALRRAAQIMRLIKRMDLDFRLLDAGLRHPDGVNASVVAGLSRAIDRHGDMMWEDAARLFALAELIADYLAGNADLTLANALDREERAAGETRGQVAQIRERRDGIRDRRTERRYRAMLHADEG